MLQMFRRDQIGIHTYPMFNNSTIAWGSAGGIGMSYLMDCYPSMVLEGMVGLALVNNLMGMVISFVCTPWLNGAGVLDSYFSIAILDFVGILTIVPMIFWGK